jgi:hypothetical protein
MRRRLRVTVTKIRRPAQTSEARTTPHGPCLICAREVELLTRVGAAEVLEVGLGALDAFISAGRVHAVETASGSVRVCKDSLFAPGRAAPG